MKRIFGSLVFVLALSVCNHAIAGVKRALIIGIDNYAQTPQTPAAFASRGPAEREGWQNLNGCVNDAKAVYQLITARYGFLPANIDTMYNKQATHETILNAINNLISACQPQSGDVVLIYYAGHGSQVKNSRSYDGTGQDQTMVPSDLWDIRNKELSPLFNQFLDRGVTLTLIFDCCHSGALARGNALPFEYVTRQAPSPNFDFNDPSEYPKIEERGALVFSAAQRDQTAKEAKDENGIAHGAFTLALIHAINSATTNESAFTIFTRIVANLKSNNGPPQQDPVIGGTEARKNATLFGSPVTEATTRTIVGVQEITDGYVQLRGGYELSIYPGCRFAKPDGKDTLEVVSVAGIGTSMARVASGSAEAFHPGDIVEMLNWVVPDRPSLLIWYPTAKLTAAELTTAIAPATNLFASGYFSNVLDQTEVDPDYIIKYHVDHWILSQRGKKDKALDGLSDKTLKKEIRKGASVSLQLPATKELDASLRTKIGAGSKNSAVDITSDPQAANYILAGRSNGHLEYALVRPNISANDTTSVMALPVRSKWVSGDVADKTSDSISDYAIRLGKLNAWMNLASPPDDFPYHLALKKTGGGIVEDGGTVYNGEHYELILKLDVKNFRPCYCKRYINVFGVDVHGKMALLYPKPALGDGNTIFAGSIYTCDTVVPLYADKPGGKPVGFTVIPPFGYDTYFMVTSETPLPADIFNSEGVMDRGAPAGPSSPLGNMMRNYGARSRSFAGDPPPAVSERWSISKMHILSAEKK